MPYATIVSRFLYAACIASAVLLSCGSGTGNNMQAQTTAPVAYAAPAYDNSLAKGVVVDSVRGACGSYAIYLPKYYNAATAYPCIYCFDAHARGALPLRMYQQIAEKYGFILIGSNISKNGLDIAAHNQIIAALWNDTHNRLHLDSSRIYTSGFSGGSKVASLAAITHGGVAGVIGCAGGFPNIGPGFSHDFDYFALVGDYDFNLPELVQLDGNLSQFKNPHQLLTFRGIHSWAPVAEFRTAVLWMMVNSMKRRATPKNDTIIAALQKDFDSRIASATAKADWAGTVWLTDGAARALNGLTDITVYNQQIARRETHVAYKQAAADLQKILSAEQTQKQELAAQFATHDEQWWKQKITALNQQASHSNLQQANATHRVLAYLGFVCYMNVANALANGDMAHASSYINIFKMADRKNPDFSYFAALFNMKNNNSKGAMAALTEAATLGYSDTEQLTTEPAFAALLNDATFRLLMEKVKNNRSGKTLP